MEENAMGIFPEMLWCAVPVTIGLLAVGYYYLITGVSRGPETVQGPKQLPKQDHKPEEMVLNDGQLQTPSTPRRGERKRNQPDRFQVEHHKKNYCM